MDSRRRSRWLCGWVLVAAGLIAACLAAIAPFAVVYIGDGGPQLACMYRLDPGWFAGDLATADHLVNATVDFNGGLNCVWENPESGTEVAKTIAISGAGRVVTLGLAAVAACTGLALLLRPMGRAPEEHTAHLS